MREFASRLWTLVKPYRFRLLLGVAAGVLCGLVEPLLMITVMFVINAIFPTTGGGPVLNPPSWSPPWLHDGIAGLNASFVRGAANHGAAMLFVVGAIPM